MLRTRSVMYLASILALASACGGDDGDSGQAGSGGGAGVAGAGSGGSSGGGSGGAGMAGGGTGHEFDAGSEPDRNQVAAGELCDRLSIIQCAAEAHCCHSATRDFAACQAEALSACNGSLMLDTIAGDARVGFDMVAASSAFMAYETRASTCDTDIASWAASSAGFMSSFNGTVAADGDCSATGGLGASTNELVAALASCNRSAGLACLPATDGWKCVPRADAGGACITDFNCQDGLYCAGAAFGDLTAGTCMAAKAAGQACGLPTECASLVCAGNTCAASGDAQAVFCPE